MCFPKALRTEVVSWKFYEQNLRPGSLTNRICFPEILRTESVTRQFYEQNLFPPNFTTRISFSFFVVILLFVSFLVYGSSFFFLWLFLYFRCPFVLFCFVCRFVFLFSLFLLHLLIHPLVATHSSFISLFISLLQTKKTRARAWTRAPFVWYNMV